MTRDTTRRLDDDRDPDWFVSTGALPAADLVDAAVREAHARFGPDPSGTPSQVYPALAAVPPALFGVCVAGVDGRVHAAGDADHPFTIMSVSKPFVFALVCQALGADVVRGRIGVNATGLPFDSAGAIERTVDGTTNPMVNAGAIATTGLVPGGSGAERWRFLHAGLSRFAGRELALDDEVYASASATNHRNQALARMLQSVGRLDGDPRRSPIATPASARSGSPRPTSR